MLCPALLFWFYGSTGFRKFEFTEPRLKKQHFSKLSLLFVKQVFKMFYNIHQASFFPLFLGCKKQIIFFSSYDPIRGLPLTLKLCVSKLLNFALNLFATLSQALIIILLKLLVLSWALASELNVFILHQCHVIDCSNLLLQFSDFELLSRATTCDGFLNLQIKWRKQQKKEKLDIAVVKKLGHRMTNSCTKDVTFQ